MKVRIRGNSIRMRVSQSELAEIAAAGACEDAVRFRGGARLAYRVEVRAGGVLAAEFDGAAVTLKVPRAAVDRWSRPEEVSIHGTQALDDGTELALLLEKDFTCLVPRADEDAADLFPNPAAAAGPPGEGH